MDKELKTRLCAKARWHRFLYMLFFAIALFIATWCLLIIGAIALIQFIFSMLVGKPNKQLLSFSESFSQYIYQIINYITFVSDEKPFPYGAWPRRHNE
jgi:hypothetical protein